MNTMADEPTKYQLTPADMIEANIKPHVSVLNFPDRDEIEIISGANVMPVPVRWLWPGWLARGKFHLLAGAGGTGKSTISLSFAAMITSGGRWPDGAGAEPGDVLMWSGEDDIADTLMPRFLVAGGNRDRIHFIAGRTKEGRKRPFDPATDMETLIGTARKLPNLAMLIIDPVVSAVRGDSHKNSETRLGLQPVVDFAAELGCVALGISHLSKNTSGREPLERVTGSIAFGAVARGVMLTVKSADQSAPRRLVRAKSNLGPSDGGFEYGLFSAPVPGHDFNNQRVDWGNTLEGTARSLMEIEEPDTAAGAREEAKKFLLEQLKGGAVPVRDLEQAAKAHGHAWITVKRAKREIGVLARKRGKGRKAGWRWELPPDKGIAAPYRES
jgi:putative DNA primase/helicase